MELITSRKNNIVAHLRRLGRDIDYRNECNEYLCDGIKLLKEAVAWNAEITFVATCTELPFAVPCGKIIEISQDILDYISPMKNPSKVVFGVKMRCPSINCIHSAIVLDTVQDPGNVGTILRTANAFEIDLIILCGACADIYNPKTVRASMGAVFRQAVIEIPIEQLKDFLKINNLKLIGTALSEDSYDIREINLEGSAVAIGSEGKGLSSELLALCNQLAIIPMSTACESLNAAIAASVVMWEMNRENIKR